MRKNQLSESGSAPKTMTTKEIAEQLTVDTKTIRENAKKCIPNKVFENGKQTYFTKEEVTILLDYMRTHKGNNRTDLYLEGTGAIATATTELTPALKLKKTLELAQEAYEEEFERIKAEKLQLQQQNENLQIELD